MPYKKEENPCYISEKYLRTMCSLCREYNGKKGRQVDCRRCYYVYRRLYSLIFDYPFYKLCIILKHRGGY